MIDYEYLLQLSPYSLNHEEKQKLYEIALSDLGTHHYMNCEIYRNLCDRLGQNPPLPVRLFKQYSLCSVTKENIVKTMTSSGTSGQAVSKIYLDKETSLRQTKVLSKIVSDFTGKTRLPMLVIDSKAVLKNRNMFSARGAGILGFSMLGRDITYALDEKMQLDWKVLDSFCKKYAEQEILMFGFTFMIWKYFYQPLKKKGYRLPLKGVLIHGGGWKKLSDIAVDADTFRKGLKEVTALKKVLNYYGMVEQTGSIFMECEYGHLHASLFSDIEFLPYSDFSCVKTNKKGLIKLVSLLPTSYPGHILLTEDKGELLGEDNCPCGRLGKYFKIYGRIKGAEIRGCSDTYEQH
ncbi:acyl-protein synthetase [bacterium 1XD42-1]|nr:acyl-protein synthetase [bacterium 1XD42-8]RKJ64574.1 acyl-protein synthetase [bacterium 1XD42-1]